MQRFTLKAFHGTCETLLHMATELIRRRLACFLGVIDSGLVGSTNFHSWGTWLNGNSFMGYHESRRCSRESYPESYFSKYSIIRRKIHLIVDGRKHEIPRVLFGAREHRVRAFLKLTAWVCSKKSAIFRADKSPGWPTWWDQREPSEQTVWVCDQAE